MSRTGFARAACPAAVFAAILFTLSQASSAEDPGDVYEKFTYNFTGGEYENESFGYRLMSPAQIVEGETYPLILFLHGAGERGDDNESQLMHFPGWMAEPERREDYPCFVLVPQCSKGEIWSSIHWRSEPSATLDDDPADHMKMVVEILDLVVAQYPIDARRIYLTGLSMGGFGSWELAMRRPDYFAAVAPVCGGGDLTKAELLVDIPIYAYHGDADRAISVERTREIIAAIREAGGSPRYRELPGVGHNSWNAAYHDDDGVIPWMFEQRLPE